LSAKVWWRGPAGAAAMALALLGASACHHHENIARTVPPAAMPPDLPPPPPATTPSPAPSRIPVTPVPPGGVSADDLDGGDAAKMATERQQIARVAQQMHIPYPVLVGGGALSDLYGNLDSLPASFFVNRQGVIVATEYGLVSKSDIEANVRKALGE